MTVNLLYIDPGTGSMLFSVLIGVMSAAVFLVQRFIVRMKFFLSGGKTGKAKSAKIPYLIFSDSKRYWNVFRPICDEFERRGIDVAFWTASPDDPALSASYRHVKAEFIGEGNKAFARLNMAAAYLVVSTTPGLDVYQWKRSRNVDWYVHVYHSVGDGGGYRMFGLYAYDAIFAGGPVAVRFLNELDRKRGLPQKDIRCTGITYMDELKRRYDAMPKEMLDRRGKTPTVLVSPSWGQSALLSRYGSRLIAALLGTGMRIIIRPHPQSVTSEKDMLDRLMAEFPESGSLSWNFDQDNFSVLSESDVMISDFSGVIYDYALIFNRPVIYAEAVFDPAPYDAAWLDGEKWLIQKLPMLGYALKEDGIEDVGSLLQKALHDGSIASSRESLMDECWVHRGESARVTVDALVEKYNELMAV